MTITASRPAAASSPAVTAIWCPKLRASEITVTRSSAARSSQQQVERGVAAAVVDVDELEVEVGALVRRRDQRVVERADAGGLVVHRQHVGEQAAGGGRSSVRSRVSGLRSGMTRG